MMQLPSRIDHFEILNRVGQGSSATVYKARDMLTDEVVALKLLHPHLLNHQHTVLRFMREERVMKALIHKNIVPILEARVIPVTIDHSALW
jgi:serine/threonine protein kinase